MSAKKSKFGRRDKPSQGSFLHRVYVTREVEILKKELRMLSDLSKVGERTKITENKYISTLSNLQMFVARATRDFYEN